MDMSRLREGAKGDEMNPDEAMQEIGEWLDPVGTLGCIWRGDGRWVLNGNWANMEAVECYLTGWLQKWVTQLEDKDDRSNIYTLDAEVRYRLEKGWCTDQFLPALWAAYKDVNKIEVTK